MDNKIIIKKEINLYNTDYISKFLSYPISNENLSNIGLNLERISNVTNYVGICGGGTQNLYILSKLCQRNKIREITLIDENKLQLDHFKHIVAAYNKSLDPERYTKEIIKLTKKPLSERVIFNLIRYLRLDRTDYIITNLNRPTFDKNIRITLVYGDIFDFLSKIGHKGKYFLYLSNILNYRQRTTNVGKRNFRLKEVLKNRNIDQSSLLLLITSNTWVEPTKATLIRKFKYIKPEAKPLLMRLFSFRRN